MSVIVEQQSHTLLLLRFSHPWTIDELLRAHNTMVAFLTASPMPISLIIDYQHGGDPPIQLITHLRTLWQGWPAEKNDRVIVAGLTNAIARFMADIVSSTFLTLTLVDTLEDAYDQLNQHQR